MDQKSRDQLRFCALCQNPCRFLFPAGVLPKESSMCSAMAYLAHAVQEGFVDFTPEVEARLSDLEGCTACKEACPHGVDTPALVIAVRQAAQARK